MCHHSPRVSRGSSPWAWTARVSYVRLELEKGHLSETKQLLGLATGRKGRTGGSAEGKLRQPHTDSERIINTVIWCQPRH